MLSSHCGQHPDSEDVDVFRCQVSRPGGIRVATDPHTVGKGRNVGTGILPLRILMSSVSVWVFQGTQGGHRSSYYGEYPASEDGAVFILHVIHPGGLGMGIGLHAVEEVLLM